MKPLGNTNIPLGTEFGWNLLDPQALLHEGAPYSDTKTKKYLILLTRWCPDLEAVRKERRTVSCKWQPEPAGSVPRHGGEGHYRVHHRLRRHRLPCDGPVEGMPGDNYFEPDADGREIAQVSTPSHARSAEARSASPADRLTPARADLEESKGVVW